MTPYVSIDIETTGLDPNTCQILEIGAVIDDWETPVDELPTFHCYVDNGQITGSPYALSMHPTILRRIAIKEEGYQYLVPDDVPVTFLGWLMDKKVNPGLCPITCAGKNFAGFDRQFLERLTYWKDCVPTNYRSIAPGSMYWNPREDMNGPPATETCMERAGIQGPVTHAAVEDAIVVVKLIRAHFKDSHG